MHKFVTLRGMPRRKDAAQTRPPYRRTGKAMLSARADTRRWHSAMTSHTIASFIRHRPCIHSAMP